MALGCRTCLCRRLGTLRSASVVRRYATVPTPSDIFTADGEERNSHSLRNKIEHLLRMQNPEAAERTLRHSVLKGSEYSWNLIIKHYAKLGRFSESERIYQLMKKCGAKPIVDTYVQLAHALNSLYSRQKSGVPPKAQHALDIIDRLNASNLPNWSLHKGIGILLQILKTTAIQLNSNNPETLLKLIEASKLVWEKSDPMGPMSRLAENEKEMALTHFLFILSLSPNPGDWELAVTLLPFLHRYPSTESRLTALRIARCKLDVTMAKQYWDQFANLPFDSRSAKEYLIILSSSTNEAETALVILDQIIKNSTGRNVHPKIYSLALNSCLPSANVRVALQIFERVQQNLAAQQDFRICQIFLEIFLRATQRQYLREKYPPDIFYSIIRKLDAPSLLKRQDIPAKDRIIFIHKIQKLVDWRIKQPTKEKGLRAILLGDQRFYKRWQEIIENQVRPIGDATQKLYATPRESSSKKEERTSIVRSKKRMSTTGKVENPLRPFRSNELVQRWRLPRAQGVQRRAYGSFSRQFRLVLAPQTLQPSDSTSTFGSDRKLVLQPTNISICSLCSF